MLNYIELEHTVLTFERKVRHIGLVRRHWFPGYMFLRFDPEVDRWHQVMRIPGTIEMLGSPTPIDEATYYDLVLRCPAKVDDNNELTVIPAGSEVKILAGAYINQTGIVSDSKYDTVWVELFAFNRPTRAELKTKHVMIIEVTRASS